MLRVVVVAAGMLCTFAQDSGPRPTQQLKDCVETYKAHAEAFFVAVGYPADGPAPPADVILGWFEQADANSDGKIDAEETVGVMKYIEVPDKCAKLDLATEILAFSGSPGGIPYKHLKLLASVAPATYQWRAQFLLGKYKGRVQNRYLSTLVGPNQEVSRKLVACLRSYEEGARAFFETAGFPEDGPAPPADVILGWFEMADQDGDGKIDANETVGVMKYIEVPDKCAKLDLAQEVLTLAGMSDGIPYKPMGLLVLAPPATYRRRAKHLLERYDRRVQDSYYYSYYAGSFSGYDYRLARHLLAGGGPKRKKAWRPVNRYVR